VLAFLKDGFTAGRVSFGCLVGGPLLAVAGTMAGLIALTSRAQAGSGEGHGGAGAGHWRGTLPIAGTCLFLLLAMLHSTGDATFYSWMPRFLGSEFANRPFAPGLVLSFYSAAYLLGRLALTWLPDAFAPRALLIAPGLIGGALALLSARSPSFTGAATLYVAASGAFGLEFPSLMGAAARRYPERFSTLCGLVSATNLVAAIGVFGTGRLAETTGSLRPGLSIVAMAFIAFGLLAATWLKLNNKAPAHVLPNGTASEEEQICGPGG
jgi:fucose permease